MPRKVIIAFKISKNDDNKIYQLINIFCENLKKNYAQTVIYTATAL
jgi:hypothetical protein